MAKRGRPTKFTRQIADRILQRLAAGKSLRSICADEDMPAESTVRGWVIDDVQGFSAQYARARDMGIDSMADESIEIADDGRNDTYVDYDQDGKAIEKVDYDNIKRSQLRVSARHWYISRVGYKKYGNKLDLNHGGHINITVAEIAKQLEGNG